MPHTYEIAGAAVVSLILIVWLILMIDGKR